MAKLDRAALKAFFETGDKPTQSEFADLIDSFLSLAEDSSFTGVVNIDSVTPGKMRISIGDTFIDITTDGGTFAEAFLSIFISQTIIGWGNAHTTYSNAEEILHQLPADKFYTLLAGGSPLLFFSRTAGGLNKFSFRLPTFADNAAAIAGGLSVFHFYQTATGEVRTVF